MGAGGVIHNQAWRLVELLKAPCFYDALSDDDKAKVEAIRAKPLLSRDIDDVMTLLGILNASVHR